MRAMSRTRRPRKPRDWNAVSAILRRGGPMRDRRKPPPSFPVICMDCGEEYGESEIAGSTGLCDECLENRG